MNTEDISIKSEVVLYETFDFCGKYEVPLVNDCISEGLKSEPVSSESAPSNDVNSTQNSKVKFTTYCCNFCSYSTLQRPNLLYHLKRHTAKLVFKCEKCQHQCYRKADLKRHLVAHSSEKSFICSFCQYKYKYKRNLKKHMKRHLNPYKCTECSFTTHRHNSLSEHMWMHKNDPVYNCNKCSYETSHKHCILAHLKIHKNDRPYHCSECDKRFIHKHHLKSHMMRHKSKDLK